MTTTLKYIPFNLVRHLNDIAERHGRKSLLPECPILSEGNNIPIILAVPGLQSVGWVRVMIPVSIDRLERVLLDVPLEHFGDLPSVEIENEVVLAAGDSL